MKFTTARITDTGRQGKGMRPVVFLVVLAFSQFLGLTAPAIAANHPPLEYQVKAAFLYNFTKFIEWPEERFSDASTPIVICILDRTPFAGALTAVSGKRAKDRSVVIRTYQGPADLETCHLLFINTADSEVIRTLLGQTEGRAVVTVGETDGFARAGGVFNFFIKENKVRFEINMAAGSRQGVTISSKLLRLGRLVSAE